jgi:hypothetical protein
MANKYGVGGKILKFGKDLTQKAKDALATKKAAPATKKAAPALQRLGQQRKPELKEMLGSGLESQQKLQQ